MSQDERNILLGEYITALIKTLLKSNEKDRKFRLCENFVYNIIRKHRNLSVSSHAVRRNIDAIVEKFTVDNYGEFANYFTQLCETLINHPLCVDHYEVDIQWSIIDFLISLAYRPVIALRQNIEQRERERRLTLNAITEAEYESGSWYEDVSEEITKSTDTNDSNEDLLSLLREDFIEPLELNHDDDSELSTWSDDPNNDETNFNSLPVANKNGISKDESKTASLEWLSQIKPPKRDSPYTVYDGAEDLKKFNNVQQKWWLSDDTTQADVESNDPIANFATSYVKHLNSETNHLIEFATPATAIEHCLLRETIWMFTSPAPESKFYCMHNDKVVMCENITIPSVSVIHFVNFMDKWILPPMNLMYKLLHYIKCYSFEELDPVPHTIEAYVYSLEMFLVPIKQKLIDYELRLLEQRECEINTIISFLGYMRESFKRLELLDLIHKRTLIKVQQELPHIRSLYMLTELLHFIHESVPHDRNILMALLVISLRPYCDIIDNWWYTGMLSDCQTEFLASYTCKTDYTISIRNYDDFISLQNGSAKEATQSIIKSRIFQLLRDHVVDASIVLGVIHEIGKLDQLMNICEIENSNQMYRNFIRDVMQYVTNLSIACHKKPDDDESNDEETDSTSFASNMDILKQLDTNDDILLGAFAYNIIESPLENSLTASEPDAQIILEHFEKADVNLPLEHIVLSTLQEILRYRIVRSNEFVVSIYREEFLILDHIQHLRNVILIEASDVMQTFYSKLFTAIETGKEWANEHCLNEELDDIISLAFPKMSSLIRIKIDSTISHKTNKVYEVINELTMTYNADKHIRHVITADDLMGYNKIFRMVLRVKWGMWTLENMQFVNKRIYDPYASLQLIDINMRRLQQLRFWLLYTLGCVYFYLTTHVLLAMGKQLVSDIEECTNLNEMRDLHHNYILTACKYCLTTDEFQSFRTALDMLLNLIYVLKLEWESSVVYFEECHGLLPETPSDREEVYNDFMADNQLDVIETTYIRCHRLLGNILNTEAYTNRHNFLCGLCATINASIPY